MYYHAIIIALLIGAMLVTDSETKCLKSRLETNLKIRVIKEFEREHNQTFYYDSSLVEVVPYLKDYFFVPKKEPITYDL